MEHVDVLIMGAGLSGVGAGHYLKRECPWASFAILEARGAIGGTWDLFRYPGVRSDSDMFTLGYDFRPWNGKKAIAEGETIVDYIRETARVTGVDQHIRFHHRVVSAHFRSDDAKWHVTVERLDAADPARVLERVELTCGFLFSCAGYYRYDRGHAPSFPGAERFRGQLIHPQFWPKDLDYTGKRVVVIGSGATAITLVPAMTDKAAHVTMLQRSPTYVLSMPDTNVLANVLRALPGAGARVGRAIRVGNAALTLAFFEFCRARPALAKKLLLGAVRRQLPAGFDVEKHFTPRYEPWDQRLCVVTNGDLFDAIKAGKASVVTDHIEAFTERGVQLRTGEHLDADIIVTATGLELLFIGGAELSVDGEPVKVEERLAYKGMMLEGVPNFAMAVGYTNASWTLKVDLTCEYVCRLLNHMRSSQQRRVVPVNHDTSVGAEQLLALSSGYVLRAADRFPKQGTKYPWQVYQSYWKDHRALKRSRVEDDGLVFSSPAPRATAGATGGLSPEIQA